MAQIVAILSRIIFQNELQRLGVWLVWGSERRFRPRRNRTERAKPFREPIKNPH